MYIIYMYIRYMKIMYMYFMYVRILWRFSPVQVLAWCVLYTYVGSHVHDLLVCLWASMDWCMESMDYLNPWFFFIKPRKKGAIHWENLYPENWLVDPENHPSLVETNLPAPMTGWRVLCQTFKIVGVTVQRCVNQGYRFQGLDKSGKSPKCTYIYIYIYIHT